MIRDRATVLVDMDGVLMDWNAGWRASLERAQLRAGIEAFVPAAEEITSFDLFMHVTTEEQREVMQSAFRDPELYGSLRPIPGAVEVMAQLQEIYDVFVVTAPDVRNPGCIPGKLDTLQRYFGFDVAKRAVFSYDKTIVVGDLLIDDKPRIKGVNLDAKTWRQVFFTQPYNSDLPGPRIEHWGEALSVIDRELRES